MYNNGGRLSKRSAVKEKGEYNDWRRFEIPSICDSRRTFFSCLMLSCFLFFILLLSPLPLLSLFPLIPLSLPFSPLYPLYHLFPYLSPSTTPLLINPLSLYPPFAFASLPFLSLPLTPLYLSLRLSIKFFKHNKEFFGDTLPFIPELKFLPFFNYTNLANFIDLKNR